MADEMKTNKSSSKVENVEKLSSQKREVTGGRSNKEISIRKVSTKSGGANCLESDNLKIVQRRRDRQDIAIRQHNKDENLTTKRTVPETKGESINKKRGWDEIENLFEKGKEKKKEQRIKEIEEEKELKERKKQQKEQKKQQRIDEAKGNFSVDGNNDMWVDDGLGGIFNSEGFTGRVEDGVKVFKAHVLNKPGSGSTPLCPFDCDCCFI